MIEMCRWILNSIVVSTVDPALRTLTYSAHFTDTRLLQTVFLFPGESPYIFSKFNPLNTDTR